MNNKRIFVEKKNGVSKEGEKLFNEFKGYLGIGSLEYVRVVNVYDILGKDQDLDRVKSMIVETSIDLVHQEAPIRDGEKYFRIQFVRGQYNQREDAIYEMGKYLNLGDFKILHSKLIIVNNIGADEINKIKAYYINPIEMEEINLDQLSYEEEKEADNSIEQIEGFINMDLGELKNFKGKYGIGMDLEDLEFCQKYFKGENRNPFITELKLIDTYWSDHCRHTTFMTELESIKIQEGKYKEVIENSLKSYLASREYVYEDGKKIEEKPVCLMDLATINMKEIKKKGLLEDKEESEEVNAASIEIDVDVDGRSERWLLMFKNETHNHPTEMEPFGGASTCLGGGIRDPLSGRSYVYQAMRITGSADPRKSFEETLAGKLPQRKITKSAMEGYSSYGNQIGGATGYLREIYDEGFLAKRMECGALVSAAPKEWVYRDTPKPGDLILLVGGKTGRDGLGGAVGSSKEHTEESLTSSGAEVQKGNPPLERKIVRLFRKKEVCQMIKKCNDFGAGGVSVAIGELADGLYIELDKVPLKYRGLDGTEIALSESQERMALVIDRENLEAFLKEADKEDVDAIVIAQVTEEKVLKMVWKNQEIVNIKREFLDTNGIRKKTSVEVESPRGDSYFETYRARPKNLKDAFIDNLRGLNRASQKSLVENFDSSVGGTTVLMPYGGKYQLSPSEGMVGKIPVLQGNTTTCSIMTYGYEPEIGKWSPYHGAYYAVIDSIARVVALGGDYRKVRLTFQEYFERLGEDKEKWGKPFSALLGAYEVQKNLDIPSIGGKDSMSGSFEDIDVPPTLISFAVGQNRVENVISQEFKRPNSKVLLAEIKIDENYLVDFEDMKKTYGKIKELVDKGYILAAMSVKDGGIARAVSEMAFGNKIGIKVEEGLDLFKPLIGSIVLELREDIDLSQLEDLDYSLIGKTIEEDKILLGKEEIAIDEVLEPWMNVLDDIFENNRHELEKSHVLVSKKDLVEYEGERVESPRVLIPVFMGNHSEYTMEKAFSRQGADVEVYVFKTKTVEDVNKSYKDLADKIREAHIIGFPDGQILGNEPEAGGKLLKEILNNEYVKDAMDDHINKKGGLVIGIGSGFQAILKAGLISRSKVVEEDIDEIVIVENKSGSFVSTMVDIEVVSNNSPWFKDMEVGKIYTAPIGIKEGRLSFEGGIENIGENIINTVFANINPTGSKLNIESLCSPCGRVFGTLAGIDRLEEGLYKNIDIKDEINIFKSAVKYFQK